jgi:hypothetical protein
MTKATITLTCPPMAILHKGLRHWRTAVEQMVAQITFEDFTGLMLHQVTIPETEIAVHLLQFPTIATVAACVGSGADGAGNSLGVALPAEPVVVEGGGLVAKAIVAPVILLRADGSKWTGNVTFPDCKVSGGTAATVTATGTLEKQ